MTEVQHLSVRTDEYLLLCRGEENLFHEFTLVRGVAYFSNWVVISEQAGAFD